MEITSEFVINELKALKERTINLEYDLYRSLLFIEYLMNTTGYTPNQQEMTQVSDLAKEKIIAKYPNETINFS